MLSGVLAGSIKPVTTRAAKNHIRVKRPSYLTQVSVRVRCYAKTVTPPDNSKDVWDKMYNLPESYDPEQNFDWPEGEGTISTEMNLVYL